MKNELMKDSLVRLLSAGKFPNEKNRVWTMCNVVVKLLLQTIEEAEKSNLTNEQFYLSFENIINAASVKDHTKQDNTIIDDFKKFNADSGK